jgi:hypothetical protein
MFELRLPGEDAEATARRQREALAICGGCPELSPCWVYHQRLPRHHQPTGVVAGLLWLPYARGPRTEPGPVPAPRKRRTEPQPVSLSRFASMMKVSR